MRARAWSISSFLGVLFVAQSAHATNVTEFPDNGSEQMGRGGAWIARASDPLATMFNPAGLAGQHSRITLQNNFIFEHTCFTRLKAANDTTFVVAGSDQDPLAGPDGRYPKVCNDVALNINPQLGATIRLSDRVGLGLLVIGPSSAGEKTFPDFVEDGQGQKQAAPNRFLLVKQSGIILFPTIGVGWEVIDDLRIGASVSWGFARVKLANAAPALNIDNGNATNDVRTNLQAADYFVPGFTLGTIWSATSNIDVAGWYKWSDAINLKGDLGSAAGYYSKQNANGDDSSVRYGDTYFDDCGTSVAGDKGKCKQGETAEAKFVVPMEAKLGIRYHQPRTIAPAPVAEGGEGAPAAPTPPPRRIRDPLATDAWDLEANLTWANNSAADNVQIRFPGDATGQGLVPVSGTGGQLPPNADQPRGYKDVFGIRIGGDYNVLPDRLALRAGSFFETSAGGSKYQNLDFNPQARVGFALGGTYRVRLGDEPSSSALEFSLGYGHVFFMTREEDNRNAQGLPGLSGTSCVNGGEVSGLQSCRDGNVRYRTAWPVNLGTITNAINVINVGASYRF